MGSLTPPGFAVRARRWGTLFFSVAAAMLTGCRPTPNQSRGVELVLSSTSPTPAMTFELRFDQVVVPGGQVGSEATNAPLQISPPLAGRFIWLSPRSGVFTPSEPLAMDTRYELTLRSGLKAANGQPMDAALHHVLTTPPFTLLGFTPRAASTNAASEPEVRLVFNADLEAREAGRFMEFADDQGRQVPAEARQGIQMERLYAYELGANASVATWEDTFTESQPTKSGRRSRPAWSEEEQTNEVANLVVVTPRQPLPLGHGWHLVVGAGLPATDPRLRLHERAAVPIGDVTPFVLEDLSVHHVINSDPAIRLRFSKAPAESLTNSFTNWMEIVPAPENLKVQIGFQELVLEGGFRSQSTYKLKLRAGLPAAEPFGLASPCERQVTIPPVEPRLYFPAFSTDQMAAGNRSFPLLLVNTPQVRVRAKVLDPQSAIHALRGYAGYFRSWRERMASKGWDEPYKAVDYNLVPGRTVFNDELPGTTEIDASATLDLQWDKLLPGRKTGVVFLEAERAADDQAPRLGTQALIQLTDLGMVWKEGRDGLDVFVFSQTTGKPVPGATAWWLSPENEVLREATTDANGLARLIANPKLAGTNTVATGPRRHRYQGSSVDSDWIAVRLGDDFHALELDRHRLETYQFGLPTADEDAPASRRRILLFTDRDFYRPGETVYLKGIARDWTDAGLSIPTGLTGFVTVADARARQLLRTNVAFNQAGSWSLPIALPAVAPRGTTLVELHLGDQTFNHSVEVADFQPSAFEIALPAKPVYLAGEKVELPLSARYFFGKPLARAKVKWTIDATDTAFQAPRFEKFSFAAVDLENHYGRGASTASLAGEGTLGSASNLVIRVEVPMNPTRPQPRTVSAFVEITDLNQQTLSHQVEFTRHSSDFYLGLKAGAAELTAGRDLAVSAAAVGADQQPWSRPVAARLTLWRVNWENVLVRGAGRTARYHNQRVVTNLLEKDILIQPVVLPAKPNQEVAGQPITGLAPTEAGQYVLEVRAQDQGGRPIVSSINLEVSAPAAVGWNYRNDVQIPLQPDQAVYTPGQTAEVLVETPISGMALVTVERETVRQAFLTRLEGNAPVVRIPIEPGDAPNVFVSVTLVRGAQDSPHQIKEPDYRAGYCQLTVQDERNRLAVSITPAATNCLPAQMVEVTVDVRDARDAAVGDAEVTLYAVDEGILSLSGHADPDPFAFFYEPRPLAVRSSISLPNLLTEDRDEFEFHNKGYLGGGGGGEEHLRKNFLACAFWNATLKTGADGKLVARFPAPDSLTRYRLMAVAHAGAGAFGAAHAAFQVTKPLVVEPALARFANLGDHQTARAVVHNQTSQAGDVLVSLELDNKARLWEGSGTNAQVLLSKRLPVAANGSAIVEFPIEFIETGSAKWIWKARFADPAAGGFTDAVQSTLSVGYPAPLLREILLARTAAAETNLLARANPQLLAGQGAITVHVANTRLVELVETLAYLLHYPYGCVEQASSCLLPWVVLHDLPGLTPLLPYDQPYREGAVRSGVARLISMQTPSGGLGYWPGAKEPMLWGSAYGGLVLALAERRGIEVPHDDLGRLMDYLSAQLRTAGTRVVEVGDAPLALYALSIAGRSEPAYQEQLFAQRARLSPEDRALVALAVAENQGSEEMIRELLSTNVLAREYDDRRFDCSARERAIRLLAWTRFKPADPQVDGLARDLMNEQEQAHWGTTQGDAWALLALTEYARRVEGAPEPATGRLVWGEQVLPFELTAATNVFTANLPFAKRGDARLTLMNASGKRLYTSLTLEARPPVARQPRQDHGFSLARSYQRLNDDGHPQPLAALRVGDRVLVTLRLAVREAARYVAVDDALPSTFEVVNPEFKDQGAHAQPGQEGGDWVADFREIRQDRFLSFADWVAPGNYELRYLARVRAAGTVTAPSAKVEAMYHPSRNGLTESETITSRGME